MDHLVRQAGIRLPDWKLLAELWRAQRPVGGAEEQHSRAVIPGLSAATVAQSRPLGKAIPRNRVELLPVAEALADQVELESLAEPVAHRGVLRGRSRQPKE